MINSTNTKVSKDSLEQSSKDEGILQLTLEDFSGPLDLLLELARQGKTDLTKLSMSNLADQYLSYLANYKKHHKHITADYLLMACVLVLMKSRLLLPALETDDDDYNELYDPELLALRLEHLNQIQINLDKLLSLQKLGKTQFLKGQNDEKINQKNRFLPTTEFAISLIDLYKSYGLLVSSNEKPILNIKEQNIYSIESAFRLIRQSLIDSNDWQLLLSLFPRNSIKEIPYIKSVISAILAATLELIRIGEIEISQIQHYSPLSIKLCSLNTDN